MAEYVVLRTHGGLGNQMFQVLFGRLLANHQGRTLLEVHDRRYKHAFARSSLLASGGAPSISQLLLSAARIPKILQRGLGWNEVPWCCGRSIYLDGYFQRSEQYEFFSDESIAFQLQRIADELRIEHADLDACLVHLRVGDFFADPAASKAHVLKRLRNMPLGASVMTNEEDLLREPEIALAMSLRNARLISTQGMKAEDVLRTMARYKRIDANDSTLTFWASVLSGCQVPLRDEGLRVCRDLLASHRLARRAAG